MHHPHLHLATFVACLALAGCTASFQPPAPAASAANGDAALVARGRYLVRIAGCNDCHTTGYAEKGGDLPEQAWLLGSPLGYHGPWGTTYAANLRLKLADMDEAAWLKYSADMHTRPIMPDFNVRAMTEGDRRAIYRFIRSLGPAGDKAPDYLPQGRQPSPPYLDLVLPPVPPAAPAAG